MELPARVRVFLWNLTQGQNVPVARGKWVKPFVAFNCPERTSEFRPSQRTLMAQEIDNRY